MGVLSQLRRAMRDCSSGWNPSLQTHLLDICRLYQESSLSDRVRGLRWAEWIAEPDQDQCRRHASEYLSLDSPRMKRREKAISLRRTLRSPLQRLFRSVLEQVPDGLGLLLEIRRDIGYSGMADMLPMTQYEISSVLQICLSPGLLQVRPVSPSSDLSLKQSVAAVEALYPFQSDDDYRIRFGKGRRVLVLVHPSLPSNPLAVLHVLLCRRDCLPTSINQILTGELPSDDSVPEVAVCYSISNGHKGAANFGLASWTIRKAIHMLQSEYPNLEAIVTFSPIPGFTKWIQNRYSHLLHDAIQDPSILEAHKQSLMQECKAYLIEQTNAKGSSLNAVYRFHVGNGARLADLHWGADLSERGIQNSLGIMCRYEYWQGSKSVVV